MIPIPEGTKLLCTVSLIEWSDEKNMADGTYIPSSINISLHVTEPGTFKNCIHTHKLHVSADGGNYTDVKQEANKYKKTNRARQMLADYDDLCGNKLRKIPEDKFFNSAYLNRALAGTELIATFGLIPGNDFTSRSGEVLKGRDNNWVKKIEPKPARLQEEDKHIVQRARNQPPAQTHIKKKVVESIREPGSDDNFPFDDDIVF
jgi:hypothetical protein